nr:NADH-quinone oxidoreductase subunit N [Ipomoea trifida]
MIYGSTGATHFDQLAKILTGYEITGARSSGIFMGILFIAVGFLFKITAVPFRAAVGWTAAYRCCPPRRATRSVVLSHKISTPPACWPGESKLSSGQLSTQSSAKNTVESRNARCWCASCSRGKKEERQGSDFTVCSMGADSPKNPWEQ